MSSDIVRSRITTSASITLPKALSRARLSLSQLRPRGTPSSSVTHDTSKTPRTWPDQHSAEATMRVLLFCC